MNHAAAQIDAPRTGEEAIRNLCYPGLHYRNRYYFDSLPVYQRMVNLAFHHGSKNILELGAGLSTALWAKYASRTYAKITTIDADFDPMWSYADSPEIQALVQDHVLLHQGVTISSAQLHEFYTNEHDVFGTVPAAAIAEHLDAFTKLAPQARMDRLADAVGSARNTRDIFISDDGALHFPMPLLDKLSHTGRFERDVAFLEKHPIAPLDADQSWDLIFFDSGEYSSNVEWLALKDRVTVGGLAAFHDIFFPKSMKNFLVCAAICADPNWQVVLLDDSTIQGLLIAQRIR